MIDALHTHVRVRKGKHREKLIVEALQEKGYIITLADEQTDKRKKIDAYLTIDNVSGLTQIKTRDDDSGTDILLCIIQPFYGRDDPRNQAGRDDVSPYEWCISHIRNVTRIVRGKTQKRVLTHVMREWEWSPRLPFDSKVYPGVQLRSHRDRDSGVIKLLAYIPPALYDTDELIATEQIELGADIQ